MACYRGCSWLRRFARACLVGLPAVFAPLIVQAESIRIVSVDTFDRGSVAEGTLSDTSVDLIQDLCGEAPNQTDEPFFDTFVGVSVRNPRPEEITIRRVRFRMRLSSATRAVLSKPLAPFFGAPISKNFTGRIFAVLLKAGDGQKKFASSSAYVSSEIGIQNLLVILDGKTSSGKKFSLRKQVSMAFANYDHCG